MRWTGDVALALQRHIESVSRSRGCVVYVFARGQCVYVLSEDHPLAHRWAVERTHEWVGCYAGRPEADVLRGDLASVDTARRRGKVQS